MAYNICLAGNGEALKNMRELGPEFSVESFEAAHLLLERLRARPASLLVLDADMPDMPGLALLRVIRESGYGRDLPVIFVAKQKTKEALAEAFSLGVDDFVEKPFDIRELRVRARAVLRRRFEAAEQWGGPLTVGDIEIDPSQRRCLAAGRRVTLRPLEFAVLEMLMLKAGRVLSRNYLLSSIWRSDTAAYQRAVDTVVSRLRKALGAHGKMIETVSKLGYCLVPPEEKAGPRAARGADGGRA